MRTTAQSVKSPGTSRKKHAAITPEGRESQLVSLATDLAEKQLRDGTASAQVIVHYLKLGTVKAKVELEMLKSQKKLADAKTDSYQSNKRIEEIMTDAMEAMKRYSMFGGDNEA